MDIGRVHDIQYLSEASDQSTLLGPNFQGKGANKDDFLKCTSGSARFTAIVEIKSPTALLLGERYRRKCLYSMQRPEWWSCTIVNVPKKMANRGVSN